MMMDEELVRFRVEFLRQRLELVRRTYQVIIEDDKASRMAKFVAGLAIGDIDFVMDGVNNVLADPWSCNKE